jgi:hypothetical protein
VVGWEFAWIFLCYDFLISTYGVYKFGLHKRLCRV